MILIPLLGFRYKQTRLHGRSSGAGARLVRWPVVLMQTILFVAVGIVLWRPAPVSFPPGIHLSILIVGSLVYFPAIALYLWGYQTLGHMFGISSGFGAILYQDHHLIQNGPYRFVRHPMYLAVILAAFGALLIFRTWAMVLFSALSWGVIVRARREDLLLEEEFGGEWETYKQHVPGWLPAFRKRVK